MLPGIHHTAWVPHIIVGFSSIVACRGNDDKLAHERNRVLFFHCSQKLGACMVINTRPVCVSELIDKVLNCSFIVANHSRR